MEASKTKLEKIHLSDLNLNSNDDCDFEIGPLEQLTKDSQLMVYHHEGDWACMDTYRDSVFLNDLWKNGNAFWKV